MPTINFSQFRISTPYRYRDGAQRPDYDATARFIEAFGTDKIEVSEDNFARVEQLFPGHVGWVSLVTDGPFPLAGEDEALEGTAEIVGVEFARLVARTWLKYAPPDKTPDEVAAQIENIQREITVRLQQNTALVRSGLEHSRYYAQTRTLPPDDIVTGKSVPKPLSLSDEIEITVCNALIRHNPAIALSKCGGNAIFPGLRYSDGTPYADPQLRANAVEAEHQLKCAGIEIETVPCAGAPALRRILFNRRRRECGAPLTESQRQRVREIVDSYEPIDDDISRLFLDTDTQRPIR